MACNRITSSKSCSVLSKTERQGSILAPVLFTLYINDLPSCVDVCKVMMYADDTVIFFSAPLISEIELQLNLELINLSEWLSTNKLILNLKKTEFMVFGTHQRLCRQDIDGAHITLGGESVKHCDAFKYLGVVLDNSLSFNLHTDYVKKKVSKTLIFGQRLSCEHGVLFSALLIFLL